MIVLLISMNLLAILLSLLIVASKIVATFKAVNSSNQDIPKLKVPLLRVYHLFTEEPRQMPWWPLLSGIAIWSKVMLMFNRPTNLTNLWCHPEKLTITHQREIYIILNPHLIDLFWFEAKDSKVMYQHLFRRSHKLNSIIQCQMCWLNPRSTKTQKYSTIKKAYLLNNKRIKLLNSKNI